MSPNSKNPATMAAGRASESFCLATEDSDDGHCPLCNQAPILGIDIGVKGAIARLTPDGELFDVFDIPCLNDGPAGRRNVNGPLLAEIIAQSHASRAYIELVGVRPGEGAVGAFSFGRSRGVVEGVVAALGVPTTHIAPASWKRAVGLPAGRDGAKDAARSEAIRRWPDKAGWFARKCDDGKAEAAFVAVAGLLR